MKRYAPIMLRMASPFEEIPKLLDGDAPFEEMAQKFCTVLRNSFTHYSWVGIYIIEEWTTLVLRAWDGPQATDHVRIPVGQGICGLAAREKKSVVVDDVNEDPSYLPCFFNTRSEIVVPIFRAGEVIGEIDIDGDKTGAYSDLDRRFLEWCAEKLGRAYGK